MIISNIIGGLGNQMFQYAAGRALSLECSESFHLDVAGFNGYGLHQGFELSRVFVYPVEIASKACYLSGYCQKLVKELNIKN